MAGQTEAAVPFLERRGRKYPRKKAASAGISSCKHFFLSPSSMYCCRSEKKRTSLVSADRHITCATLRDAGCYHDGFTRSDVSVCACGRTFAAMAPVSFQFSDDFGDLSPADCRAASSRMYDAFLLEHVRSISSLRSARLFVSV